MCYGQSTCTIFTLSSACSFVLNDFGETIFSLLLLHPPATPLPAPSCHPTPLASWLTAISSAAHGFAYTPCAIAAASQSSCLSSMACPILNRSMRLLSTATLVDMHVFANASLIWGFAEGGVGVC